MIKIRTGMLMIAWIAFVACDNEDKQQSIRCEQSDHFGEYHGRYNAHYNLETSVLTTVVYFYDGEEGSGANTAHLPSGQAPRVNNLPMTAASGRYDEEFFASGFYYIQRRQMPLASSYLVAWTKPDGAEVLNNFFFPDPYSLSTQKGGVNLTDYSYQSMTHAPNGHECFGGYVLSRMDSGND